MSPYITNKYNEQKLLIKKILWCLYLSFALKCYFWTALFQSNLSLNGCSLKPLAVNSCKTRWKHALFDISLCPYSQKYFAKTIKRSHVDSSTENRQYWELRPSIRGCKLVRFCSVTCLLLLQVVVSEHDNDMSKKLLRILRTLREKDPSSYQSCHLVKQGEQPREGFMFLANLLEDQTAGSSGYVDWILQIFRQSQISWRGGRGEV